MIFLPNVAYVIIWIISDLYVFQIFSLETSDYNKKLAAIKGLKFQPKDYSQIAMIIYMSCFSILMSMPRCSVNAFDIHGDILYVICFG